jgi:hypothetical protein
MLVVDGRDSGRIRSFDLKLRLRVATDHQDDYNRLHRHIIVAAGGRLVTALGDASGVDTKMCDLCWVSLKLNPSP